MIMIATFWASAVYDWACVYFLYICMYTTLRDGFWDMVGVSAYWNGLWLAFRNKKQKCEK